MTIFRNRNHNNSHKVSSLNLVREYGEVKPRYKQNLANTRIVEFAYLPDDQLLLLGSMDGQYPYWVSITKVNDVSTNEDVLRSILFDDFSVYTKTWPDIDNIIKNSYRRRFALCDGSMKTPFDYGLSSDPDQVPYWPQHMARGIYSHYLQLKELCRFREADGKYLDFLNHYLTIMKTRTAFDEAKEEIKEYAKKVVKEYEGKRMLMKLVQSENYLYVSENQSIKQTYIQIREEINHLHNQYMTMVK